MGAMRGKEMGGGLRRLDNTGGWRRSADRARRRPDSLHTIAPFAHHAIAPLFINAGIGDFRPAT
jgi:hypothetical protein